MHLSTETYTAEFTDSAFTLDTNGQLNIHEEVDRFEIGLRTPKPLERLGGVDEKGWTICECELTGWKFSRPAGCPTYELRIYTDSSRDRDDASPPYYSYIVHPRIVRAGPEAVRRAIRKKVRSEIASVIDTLYVIDELHGALQEELTVAWPGSRAPTDPDEAVRELDEVYEDRFQSNE